MRSRHLPFGPASLHLADFGGEGPTVLLVHGLGGSHANWVAFGPRVASRARVLALDLPGFGLSPPTGGSTIPSLRRAVRHTLGALERGEIEGARGPVTLVGNSMGGAVSILEAASVPASIASLLLVCPALPQPRLRALDRRFSLLLLSSMLPGYDAFLRRRLERAGAEAMIDELLSLTCVDRTRVPAEAVEAMKTVAVRRMSMPWMGSAFSEAARSVVSVMLRRQRFHAAMRAVRAPTVLVHGERDRLVPVAAARAARDVCPGWRLEIFDDVGHVPQLEVPDRLAAVLEPMLG